MLKDVCLEDLILRASVVAIECAEFGWRGSTVAEGWCPWLKGAELLRTVCHR